MLDWVTLADLRFMTVLDLSSNGLTGKIPEALTGLVSLERLDLHRNRFHGIIPAELGQLPRLKFLRLSSNGLSGKIPEEVASMPTLELLDCSNNNLSDVLPAWACMGTVYGKFGDPHPNQMYLFVMDAPPKSLRATSASTRDEEARARAVAWIQYHLDQDDDPAAVEEQPLLRPLPQSCRRHMGDTQVLLVDFPQHCTASIRFEVMENSGTSSFILAWRSPTDMPAEITGLVLGAVNDDVSSATSRDDFPHRVVEINSTSAGTLETSSLPTSGHDSNERQGRGGAPSVGAGIWSRVARFIGVERRAYHHIQQFDTRQDGRVEADGDIIADDSPTPAMFPPLSSSFSVKRDEEFVEAWEAFVWRDERCNNSVCSFFRDYAFIPLYFLFQATLFLTPMLGFFLCRPLIYVLWVLGLITFTLLSLAVLLAGLRSLRRIRLPSRPGDVGPVVNALIWLIVQALAFILFLWFFFVHANGLGVVFIGTFALMTVAGQALGTTLMRCGVLKGDPVPEVKLMVEPQPPRWA
ncbi:unnamed protein product [Ectocarpus sp. 8 AP-2014]